MRKAVLHVFTLLVLFSASGNLKATCPSGQTKARVIYINGINTLLGDVNSGAIKENTDIRDRFTSYAISKGIARDPDCVDFLLSYNDTRGFWHDVLVDSLLESLHPGLSKFWTWAEVDSASNEVKTSISTAVSMSAFAKKLVYDTELNRLIQNIQDAWADKRTAILFVHSEGNYYANYAYQYFKSQGVKLPDPQKLVIVSLASPAGNLLDGRNAYVKTCTDLIRAVFGSLPYNFNEPGGCSLQFPVVKSDSAVNNIYNEFVSLLTLNPQKIPGDHLMGHYLEANSALNGRVMQLLNSSLPDGNCHTPTCLWNSPSLNSWEWDGASANGGINPVFIGGLVNLTVTSTRPTIGAFQPVAVTQVNSLRQFSDNFSLQVKFLHGGLGTSEIRLDRATDNVTAAGFRIYPLGGLVFASVFSSATNKVLTATPNIINKTALLSFTATAGKVKISLTDPSGTQQIGELPWDNSGSYKLVVQSSIGMSVQDQQNILYLTSVTADTTTDVSIAGLDPILTTLVSPFTLTPSTPSLTVSQGGIGSINFALKNNLSAPGSTVNLMQYIMESVWPSGLLVSWPLTATMPAVGQTANITVTFVVPSTLVARSYPMELRASVGAVMQPGDFALIVTPASSTPFSLTSVNSAISLEQGKTNNNTFTLKNNSATAGSTVSLLQYIMENVWPTGLGVSYPPTMVMPAVGQSINVTFSFTASPTLAVRSYPMQLRGTSGSLTQAASFTINVTAPVTTGDFTASAVTSSISLQQGSNGSLQTTATPTAGFTGAVNMAVAGAPTGVTISPISGNITGTGAITLTSPVTVASTAAVGSYPLTATLTAGGKSKTVAVSLIITKAATVTTTLRLDSIQTSPQPTNVGLVRITANGLGITGTTTMELAGPFCTPNPCVPNAKISQTANVLVMDAQINNPGTFTLKLRDGSQLTAGQDFTVNPAPPPPPTSGTVGISVSGYNGGVSCNLSGVNFTAPVTLTNQPLGNKSLSCTAPSGYNITSITPSSQNLTGGGTVYFTVTLALIPAPPLSCSCSVSPNPANLGSATTLFGNCTGGKGGYQYSLNGAAYQTGNSALQPPNNNVGNFTYTVAGKDNSNAATAGSCTLTVIGVAPSGISFSPDSSPTHGVNFNGTITGNAFTPSSIVRFYGPGCTSGCQQPPAGVSVQSLYNIRLVNVKLAAGTFQAEVSTAYGSSRSGSFTVK